MALARSRLSLWASFNFDKGLRNPAGGPADMRATCWRRSGKARRLSVAYTQLCCLIIKNSPDFSRKERMAAGFSARWPWYQEANQLYFLLP